MSERLLLELVGGGRPPAELPRAGTLVLGSSKERAGFVLQGVGIAEIHAAIGKAKGGGWAIRDLGSDAGTKLNGKRIEAARLNAGDWLELGSVKLRVFDPANPAAPATSAAPTASDTAAVELEETPPRGMSAMPAEAQPSSLPVIPGYKLEKRIGKGGMGEVFLAVQERLARPVALKSLSKKLAADAQFVRRFEAEARAAAALNHPNVVTVYDVGEHGGVHYLSMEYMDRGTLEDRVQREGRVPWKAVLEILRDAASGLAYAESRGIVHRDLKPANLMQNHAGATKIADLGLATHVEAEEDQSADKKVFGTAHFMAPEQARGERADHRSDLYSLGATAYRLLTAHTPYEGATSRDILRALLREEPRSIAALAPDVPASAVQLVEKLMRKDPAQRFPSARDLVAELDRLRAGARPAEAAPAKSSKGVLIGVGLLVVVGGVVALKFLGNKPAEIPHDTTTHDTNTAQGPAQPVNPPVKPAPTPDPVAPPDTTVETVKPPVKPTKENDEKDLLLFEQQARIALLELSGRQLDSKEKAAALRAMADKFRGTTAATEAIESAKGLELEAEGVEAATSAHHSSVLALSQRLRTAAKLEDVPPLPGKSLMGMKAVEGQNAYESDPLFLAERTRLEQEVISKACEYAKKVIEDTQADLDRGDQESVKKKLSELMPVFDLPEFPMGTAPAGVETLFELGRRARERLTNLGLIATQIQTQQSREEAKVLAQGFGGPEGLEHELATMDFAHAKERVSALAPRANSPAVKRLLADLLAELDGATRSLDLVAREYQTGWRRKGVDDPRDKSDALRNALGADAQGLLLEGQGGATERVPWSAFGRNSKALGRLFAERLARDYTADECRDLVSLLHLTGLAEVLELSAKMFDPAKKANFTENNAKELVDSFSSAQAWLPKAASAVPLFARDQVAAQLLARVLQDTTEGSWASAVAGTERLLREFQDSLLVRMLSDGTLASGDK